MAQTIKIKNSSQAAKVPVIGDLAYGEIALNYADGKIYYKKSDNTIQSISGGVTSVSGTAPIVSTNGATPVISIPLATTSVSGYLSSTDWNTFNNKAPIASPTFTGTVTAPVFTGSLNGGAAYSNALRQSDGTSFLNPVSNIATSGNRGADLAPNTYTQGLFSEFKNSSLYSFTGTYTGLLTYAPWYGTTASTGDPSYQLAFSPSAANSTTNPSFKIRAGIDTTWGAWNTIWHSGNLTNLNQLTNGPGYITSYTETDTLATVTARGATTTIVPTFSNGAVIQGLTVGLGANAVAGNTAVGVSALSSGSLSGGNNVGIGISAIQSNTTGVQNVAIGAFASQTNIVGSDNTAIGNSALKLNTGYANIGLGRNAGNALTTGSNNTIIGSVPGTAGLSDTVIIAAGSAERMRISSTGNLLLGRTYSGNETIGIGGNSSSVSSGTSAAGIYNDITVSATQTASYTHNGTYISIAAGFNLATLRHNSAGQFNIGVGSSITNQYGYYVDSSLTGATNNFGFYGNIASGTNRYNLYMAGTANNYLAGNVGINTTTPQGKIDSTVSFGTLPNVNYVASSGSTAQGLLSGYSFRSTFVGTGDNGPRRSADIWSGYNNGAWGTEYLAFGVGIGGQNDGGLITTERMRINGSGNVGIGTTSPGSKLTVVGQIESTLTGYKFPDGTTQATAATGGGAWTKITTATTATTKKQYVTDTTSGAFTVTLPASPAAGDYVYFMDAGNWATNNLTIARNASTIEGVADNLVLDVKGLMVQLIYDGTTWQVMSNIGPQGPVGSTGPTGLAGTPTLNIVTAATQTAVAYNQYVLTNVALSTLTLPASPTAGDIVWVTIGNGLTTNIMARNGSNLIMGIAEDMTMNNANGNYQMRYINATLGWRIM